MKKLLNTLIILALSFCSYAISQNVGDQLVPKVNCSVMHKPSINLIGIECRTSNLPDAAPVDIPKHWQKFYNENVIGKVPNKISNEVIALYCDYEGDYTQPYSLVIGCAVDSLDAIPTGMVGKIIPSSTYAVFQAVGEHPKALIETWTNIWQQSNLKRSYTGDFEVYGENFFSESPQKVDVLIAIETEVSHDS